MRLASSLFTMIALAAVSTTVCGATDSETTSLAGTQLSADDLTVPAKLSDARRTAFVSACVARRVKLFAYIAHESPSVSADYNARIKDDIDETFPRFCSCLVKGFESGLSGLQFAMAETMIGHDMFMSYPGSPTPTFAALRRAAAELGVTSSDFDNALEVFRVRASRAADGCYLVLSGPMLAKQTGRQEFRTYPGNPPTTW